MYDFFFLILPFGDDTPKPIRSVWKAPAFCKWSWIDGSRPLLRPPCPPENDRSLVRTTQFCRSVHHPSWRLLQLSCCVLLPALFITPSAVTSCLVTPFYPTVWQRTGGSTWRRSITISNLLLIPSSPCSLISIVVPVNLTFFRHNIHELWSLQATTNNNNIY